MPSAAQDTVTPSVLIYRDFLLPPSEMFILRMAEAFTRYTPWYVGLRKMGGLATPDARTVVVNSTSPRCNLREAMFRYLDRVPRSLEKQLRGTHPALVHAQFGIDAARGMTLSKALGIPLVVHFRGYDVTYSDSEVHALSRTTRQYLRRREAIKSYATLFIAISEFIRRKAEAKGFPPDKLVTHYTGIDLEFFQPDAAVERQPVVLFAGRLTEQKGCDVLIQAMAEVQAKRPDLELVIVGDGELRSKLEQQARATLKRYRFLGWIGQQPLRDWMNRAQVLAFPSVTAPYGDAEGMGNVGLEAQAMGLPVVGHIHGGIPESIESGKTGILVAERDTRSFAGAILELAGNQQKWEQFSRAGRERVAERFDVRKQNRLLESRYDAVLADARAAFPQRVHATATPPPAGRRDSETPFVSTP